MLSQGTLKGQVSLYCWPPVWLVGNQLYDNWQFFCFYLQSRLIQTGQTGGQQYSDTTPFSVPWLSSIHTCDVAGENRKSQEPFLSDSVVMRQQKIRFIYRRHDTPHNDIQHNDTLHNDI